MRKVFTLISLMMALFTGMAQAQSIWDVPDPISVTEILGGEDHYYVLQEGYNDKGQSSDGYLSASTSDVTSDVKTRNVYQFIPVDEKTGVDENTNEKFTFKVYVMKSVENGKYLTSSSEHYTSSIEKAYKFTAQRAKIWPKGSGFSRWIVYSSHVYFQQCVDGGAWVLCNPAKQEFIGISGNPSFLQYTSTNNWYIYEVKERPMTAKEKLQEVFTKYFPVEVNTDNYNVGNDAGCVDQAVYDKIFTVYNDANNAKDVDGLDDSYYDELREAIIKTDSMYHKSVKPLEPGYYLWVNMGYNSMAYENGREIRTDKDKPAPAKWDLAAARNIWRVYKSADNKYIIQNWATNKYIGYAGHNIGDMRFPLEADSTEHFSLTHHRGLWHFMDDEHGHRVNRTGAGYLRHWNSTSDYCKFKFVPVHPDTIAKLTEGVEQNHININLNALLKEAKGKFFGLQNECGLTYDGNYLPDAKGVLKEIKANSIDKKNLPKNALDANMTTYFHSNWSKTEGNPNDYHWMQLDLGKELSSIVLKFSDRGDRLNHNRPTRVAFVAPAGVKEALDLTEAWTDTLCKVDTKSTYATKYAQGSVDSTTFIGKVDFGKPVQNVRLVVLETVSNDHRPLQPEKGIVGKGVTYNVSELRIYDAAECEDNPRFALIPEEIKANLNNLMVKAEEELAAKKGTQETVDNLEAALEAFIAAYPDPTELAESLKLAQDFKNAAQYAPTDAETEVAKIGYFKEGSIDAFGAVLASIEEALNNKVMTLDEIKAAQKQLEEATKTFNSNLILPVEGKFYRIQSASGVNDKGEENAQEATFIASANADINGNAMWMHKATKDGSSQDRLNTIWYVEKSEQGYSFKNLANGFYLNNVFNGLTEEQITEELAKNDANDRVISYSATPKYFNFAPAPEAGTITISLIDGQYVNCHPNGNVVRFWAQNDKNAKYKFIEVDDQTFSQTYALDIKEAQTQIVTVPFEVSAIYCNGSMNARKVVGMKDNKLYLDWYAEDETIPAGTPIIITTAAANEEENTPAEKTVSIDLLQLEPSEFLDVEYNYSPVIQNGLISAPQRVTLEAGYGYIYNEKILVSEGNENIMAGTGYFNHKLPLTETTTDQFIEISGNIPGGDITGVNEVVVVKNVPTDVYTVSGVLVRKNVKKANATVGLPKGVYVIGNEKVIVK